MDMTFAFISDEVGDFFAPDAEIVQIEAPKPSPEVPPFWWEDYMGRPGRPVNPDAAMEAVRAKCRDYRSDPA